MPVLPKRFPVSNIRRFPLSNLPFVEEIEPTGVMWAGVRQDGHVVIARYLGEERWENIEHDLPDWPHEIPGIFTLQDGMFGKRGGKHWIVSHDGDFYINNDNDPPETPSLSLFYSEDGCRTWHISLHLEDEATFDTFLFDLPVSLNGSEFWIVRKEVANGNSVLVQHSTDGGDSWSTMFSFEPELPPGDWDMEYCSLDINSAGIVAVATYYETTLLFENDIEGTVWLPIIYLISPGGSVNSVEVPLLPFEVLDDVNFGGPFMAFVKFLEGGRLGFLVNTDILQEDVPTASFEWFKFIYSDVIWNSGNYTSVTLLDFEMSSTNAILIMGHLMNSGETVFCMANSAAPQPDIPQLTDQILPVVMMSQDNGETWRLLENIPFLPQDGSARALSGLYYDQPSHALYAANYDLGLQNNVSGTPISLQRVFEMVSPPAEWADITGNLYTVANATGLQSLFKSALSGR